MITPENLPAFPAQWQVVREEWEGMTLRDYFAAKSLSLVPIIAEHQYGNLPKWSHENYAVEAYRFADAMLAERAKGAA